jgi:NitT/TauT family transport system substrate-binding protein
MKKFIILIAILAIIILVVIAFLYATRDNDDTTDNNVVAQAQLRTIRLNEVTRSVFYAPQYVAINQGFFGKEGLNIEITTGQGADKVMTAVLAGQSDIGFAGPEAAIYVYNEGKEDYTEVFAQLTKKDGSFLVSKTNTQEFKWTDLIGKTIIPGRKGGVPYMTLEYVIKKNGMNPKTDMKLDDSIKFDLMAGAFTGGDADYVTLFEPTASMTQNAGKGYIVASVGEAAGNIPYTAYFAKKSYIEDNQEIIQKFVKAIYEGQKWVETHTDREIAEAIKGFFPDTDIKLLETVVGRYKSIDVWKSTPVLEKEDFELLQTVMTEAGELKQKAPYDKVVNNHYAYNAVNQ